MGDGEVEEIYIISKYGVSGGCWGGVVVGDVGDFVGVVGCSGLIGRYGMNLSVGFYFRECHKTCPCCN